ETPGWMWMLLGLTMGLFVAGYIYLSDVRAPSMARQTRASEPASASTPEGGVAASRPEARQQASASARTQTAAQPATARAPAAQASTASPSTRQTSTASAASASQASSAQTSAPERESAARTTGPRFQFYENLPNSEVIVPEPTPTARAAR